MNSRTFVYNFINLNSLTKLKNYPLVRHIYTLSYNEAVFEYSTEKKDIVQNFIETNNIKQEYTTLTDIGEHIFTSKIILE